ncbi:MAG: hypothetical protein AAF628_11290 [Planctomycetota bacterium]
MAIVTRRIGLSLGADICWPQCYEDILARMDLAIPHKRDTVRFEVKRLDIEPFHLRQPANYDLVIDRLTHWYHVSREWIKKAVLMDGVYVFNNPWSVQSMEKQTTYCAMMKLGLPVPDTLLVPPKEYDELPDLAPTLERYAKLFDLPQVGESLGYPMFMKPYDGGGWVGVSKIDNAEELTEAYDKSGKFVMHLQRGVVPYEKFVRCVGLGPQLRIIRYEPDAPLHERYASDLDVVDDEAAQVLEDTTLTINAFFGWDFNSCECLLRDNTWHPIDFANPCPDSQITSLHVHFPWVVLAKMRWSLFCAATKRPMRRNLDWGPYFAVAKKKLPFREKLRAYGDLARKHFDHQRFAEFCDEHLSSLDAVAHEYFGTDRAKSAVRAKVEALFPEHEWDEFTEKFWGAVQTWREREGASS